MKRYIICHQCGQPYGGHVCVPNFADDINWNPPASQDPTKIKLKLKSKLRCFYAESVRKIEENKTEIIYEVVVKKE